MSEREREREISIFFNRSILKARYTNMFSQQVCQAIAVDCANEKARSAHTVSFLFPIKVGRYR